MTISTCEVKVERVDIIYHENNCIDIQLRYLGDCADRLDIYIDGTYQKSKYMDGGSRRDQPFDFTITAMKGCEEVLVYIHFIDCGETNCSGYCVYTEFG